MIDGLLDAALIAEPGSLRIVSVNAAAAALFGVDAAALCQQDLFELAATPEDIGFWEAHANHLDESVEAQTMISRADGRLRPVLRRVSRIGSGGRQGVYLVVMRDRSQELLAQSELEERVSELRATLESTHDGILVLDLSGRIVNANERFGTLWQVPEALLMQRDSAAVAAWMLRRVVDPVSYTRRLTALSESASAPGRDVLTLRDGSLLITNDGGPGHFATLTPIQTMVFFGPETGRLYGPLGARNLVLESGIACSPCLSAYNHRQTFCDGDNQCLKRIAPDPVLAQALQFLGSAA